MDQVPPKQIADGSQSENTASPYSQPNDTPLGHAIPSVGIVSGHIGHGGSPPASRAFSASDWKPTVASAIDALSTLASNVSTTTMLVEQPAPVMNVAGAKHVTTSAIHP
jgi:hypothetical protein